MYLLIDIHILWINQLKIHQIQILVKIHIFQFGIKIQFIQDVLNFIKIYKIMN